MITRAQIRRQLRAQGGITNVTPRQKYGLGDFVRKIIPNELATIAVKAAPFVAPFNPAVAAAMAGIGSFDRTGRLGSSLKSAALTYGGGQLARGMGGAELQGNPFSTTGGYTGGPGAFRGGGFKSGFSSPLGTENMEKLFGTPEGEIAGPIKTRKGILKGKAATEGMLGKLGLTQGAGSLKLTGLGKISAGTLVSYFVAKGASEEEAKNLTEDVYRGEGIGFDQIRDDINKYRSGELTQQQMFDKNYRFLVPRGSFQAAGGRVGLNKGGDPEDTIEAYAKRLADEEGISYKEALKIAKEEYPEPEGFSDKLKEVLDVFKNPRAYNTGGRAGYQTGGVTMANTYAQNIAANQARAAANEQLLNQARARIGIPAVPTPIRPPVAQQPITLPVMPDQPGLFPQPPKKIIQPGGPGGDGIGGMLPDFYERVMPPLMPEQPAGTDRPYTAVMPREGYRYVYDPDGTRRQVPLTPEEKYRIENPDETATLMPVEEVDRPPERVRGIEPRYNDPLPQDQLMAGFEQFKKDNPEVMQGFGTAAMVPVTLPGGYSYDFSGSLEANAFRKYLESIGQAPYQGRQDPGMLLGPELPFEKLNQGGIAKLATGGKPKDKIIIPPKKPKLMTEEELEKKYPGLARGEIYDYEKKKKLNEIENLLKKLKATDPDKKLRKEGKLPPLKKMAQGGIMNMPTGKMRKNSAGVMERDYRDEGGFVPVGIKEKADDVPAMLSKNEFVMTADAVRGAGGGSIDKGAQRMYNTMKRLEKQIV